MEGIVRSNKSSIDKSVVLNGKSYVFIDEFCQKVGVAPATVRQWNYEGRLNGVAAKYLGKLIFEERAIEPFKRSLMSNVAVVVYR